MTVRVRSVLAPVLTLLLFAATAHAQSPIASNTWFVSPLLGVAFDPDADASLTIAGSAAYPVTPVVAIEGEIGHVVDMAPGDATVDSSLTTVHASVLYFLESDLKAVPYIAAGLGLGKFSHTVTAPPASIKRTEVGFNVGAGVTYPLNGAVWLRGDFRVFKHIDDVPTAWRFAGGVSVRLGS
jgi:hypothetical protein